MKISVVGAYGYTGQLICGEFDSLNIPYSIVGRSQQKLNDLNANLKSVVDSWCLNIQNEKDCDFLLENSDIIVNCAGPFTEESNILIKKVAQGAKIYFDISGELEFIKISRENYHQTAIESKALIIHACAFESLITDLLLQKIKLKSENLEAIRSFYLFADTKASPGTRITMKLAKFRKNLKMSSKKWQESDLTTDRFDVQISDEAESFRALVYPLPEIAFSYWSYQPETVESFLLVKPEESVFIIPRMADPDSILPTLKKLNERKIAGPTKEERQKQKSKLIIQIIHKNQGEKVVLLESIDMYQTTAKAIMLSVQKILEQKNTCFGVINPARLFLGQEDSILAKLGVKVSDEKAIKIQKTKLFN